MTSLRPLAIGSGDAAREALPALRQALDGGRAVIPYGVGGVPTAVPEGATPDTGTALVVGTSGSTGTPKLAMLPGSSLVASATATHERLGGPGTWLLSMPPHHIAGVQVLVRSVVAGTTPGFVELDGGFTGRAFVRASEALVGERRYTALVPTQLVRLLDDAEATAALASFDAVLVGGAASAPSLLARAADLGVRVVTTYGMSETSGGCVYDGVPLSVSRVRVDDLGRLVLGGATLATGYLGRPDLTAEAFGTDEEGGRWFTTNDAGHLDATTGRWHVDGRLDDVITTGGLKVAPRLVEDALTALSGVAEAVVVGVPDEEWGQVVAAAVVARAGTPAPTLEAVRSSLRGRLPDHALPRRLVVVDELPQRGPGKPDRAGIAGLFPSRP
ncbi:o-succinylbenzoate--CoA ligase [Phycicoccus sp. Soil748]|uniref:o-succinylbenzoate--CoA ligase n=1 Tax=Phycicoccus sp. Soil748 TaxID=1736397 RepID=UPI00070344CC|nr:o-succinylbenzoate--CoA ligase [Phycicoccus sp. Soil748]KRE58641.1 hypothetical protein ASG70_17885 [Phycicoccus sp. Soil748]